MSSAEVWKSWEGRTIAGKFPLRQWLGGSEHSAVFLTELPGQRSQKAAIKLIPADAGDADRQLARWRDVAQLSHPHLLRIFETGTSGATLLYVVMEFADEDLSQILPQRALEPAEVAEMLPPLLDTLSYLHAKGFVHGHIRPSNVLVVGEQLKLSSDRIASTAQPISTKTRDAYDAPELVDWNASPASDVWSLGVTLVEALTQGAPAVSPDDPAISNTLPEPFRGIARECLRVDPKRRCSIAEIKARLQPPARSVPAEPEAAPAAPRPAKRGPIVAALLVVLVAVVFVVFHSRGKNSSSEKNAPADQLAGTPDTKPATPVPDHKPEPPKATPTAAPAAAPTKGAVTHQEMPDISQGARHTISGTIKIGVRVQVDPSGKVTSAKLTKSGPSGYFANLALKAAQDWEFSPPTINGQPAASTWLVLFRLRHDSIKASSEQLKR